LRNCDGRACLRELVLISAALLVLVLAVGAGGCIGPPPPPRGRIEGTVVDGISGEPIVGASIAVDNRVLGPADPAGRFAVNRLTAGQHVLSVSRYGYMADQRTVNVQAGQVTACEVQLTPVLPGMSSIYGYATLANHHAPQAASKPKLFTGSAARKPSLAASEPSTSTIQVRLRPGLTVADIADELARAGYEIVDELPLTRILLVRRADAKAPDGTIAPNGSAPGIKLGTPDAGDVSIEQAASALEDILGVDWAYPDYPVWATAVPNDPDFLVRQWHYRAISLPQAWDVSTGQDAPVTVAVIDTGISPSHPDLAGKLVPGWDFIDNDDDPTDKPLGSSHGTHVAGTIAAATDNGIGVAGVSWGSMIMPIRVLDSKGAGTYSLIMEGIEWAVQHGAQIINMSLGGTDHPGPAFETTIRNAYSRGVLLVAATGNDYGRPVLYPAAFPEVIAVGATLNDDSLAPYSNVGSQVTVTAPGGSIVSNLSDGVFSTALKRVSTGSGYAWENGYEFMHGTSMATPHVSGLAALLLSRFGPMSPVAVAALISDTSMDLGADGYDHDFGAGLVNAYAALTQSTMDRAVFAIRDSDDNWIGDPAYGRRNRTFCISNASPGECTLVGFLDVDGDHHISPGDFYGETQIVVPSPGAHQVDRLVLYYVDIESEAVGMATPKPQS
jgi:serine protease